MRIVIAGAGEVGSHLAKLLSREEQDIIVLDHDKEKLAALDSNYNLMTVVGSPTSFTCQRASGVDGECDLFIAVTPYENTNLIACAMAKSLGARRTVGRIDNYEYLDPRRRSFFSNMGVDHLIYPEYLAAETLLINSCVRSPSRSIIIISRLSSAAMRQSFLVARIPLNRVIFFISPLHANMSTKYVRHAESVISR